MARIPVIGGAHIGGRLRAKGDAITHTARLHLGPQRGAHLVPTQVGAEGRLVEPALEFGAVVVGQRLGAALGRNAVPDALDEASRASRGRCTISFKSMFVMDPNCAPKRSATRGCPTEA